MAPWSLRARQPAPAPGEFLALFLDRDDVPPPLHRICAPGDRRPPALSPPLTGVVAAGAAVWAAPGDADLHRVDDLRWLFARPGQARRAVDRIRRELGAPGTAGARVLLAGLVVARLVCTPGQDGPPVGTALAELARRAAERAAAAPFGGPLPPPKED
ncbi:hypothetical protein KNE206_05870 [Kitasatospora sp. NE20-6]|uniref:hypothetical protein n=1 Tax=Kitasatospora sp. NE20-6 TaxID=2859066 RepID=UPI0034DBB391